MTIATYIVLGILLLSLAICGIILLVLRIQLHFLYMQLKPDIINPIIKKWLEAIKERIADAGLPIHYHEDLGTAAGKYVYTHDKDKNFICGNQIQILEKHKTELRTQLFLLLHEYGHHYFLSKFNDDTEASADRYVRIFAQEMPIEEQYSLETFVHVYSGTPEVSNKEYTKMYLQKIKKMLSYRGKENGK